MKNNYSIAQRNAIVEANLWCIDSVIRQNRPLMRAARLEYDDVYQQLALRLIKAVAGYDPEKGRLEQHIFAQLKYELLSCRSAYRLCGMEGGCLDELDIRELLKHDQPFRDMWDAVGSDARIAVQQYRFRGGKQGEELGDENHFALMRAYDRALSDEDGSTFVERDDVDWLDDFELTKDDLADGK